MINLSFTNLCLLRNKRAASLLLFLVFLGGAPLWSQPNILLIESDDQSNLAVGAFGFGNMFTPSIDRLAESGVFFTAAYNMGCWSPAVCIPSRTMLFNGTFLWEAEKVSSENVPGPNLGERLGDAGYTTWFTGKWHARGKGPEETFQHVGHILPGQLKTFWTDEGHLTDIVGREAEAMVREAAALEEPFFLYVAFNAPHVPRQTEQKYYEMYPADELLIPPSVQDGPLHPHIKYNYSKDPLRVGEMRGRYQQNNAMVTHMDDRIGDILQALEETGEYGNTVIVFMSDQGICFGENGVAGKVCLYDVSVRAPLIISGPGVPEKLKIGQRIYLQDIYPTLLELAGAPVPAYMDFKSLNPLMEDPGAKSPHSSIYLAMFDDQRGMVFRDHKLILYPQAGAAELYDLKNDPWETRNIIDQKILPEHVPGMREELARWQAETGDTMDLVRIYPELLGRAVRD